MDIDEKKFDEVLSSGPQPSPEAQQQSQGQQEQTFQITESDFQAMKAIIHGFHERVYVKILKFEFDPQTMETLDSAGTRLMLKYIQKYDLLKWLELYGPEIAYFGTLSMAIIASDKRQKEKKDDNSQH